MNKIDLAMRVLTVTAKHDMHTEVFWWTEGKHAPVTFFVNCNDLFYWACADAEEITADNIELLEKTLDEVKTLLGHDYGEGTSLWCCRVRGMRPQKPYYNHLDQRIVPLFDACGPKRDQ